MMSVSRPGWIMQQSLKDKQHTRLHGFTDNKLSLSHLCFIFHSNFGMCIVYQCNKPFCVSWICLDWLLGRIIPLCYTSSTYVTTKISCQSCLKKHPDRSETSLYKKKHVNFAKSIYLLHVRSFSIE